MTVGVPEINNTSWRIKYVEKKEKKETTIAEGDTPTVPEAKPLKAGAPKGGGTGVALGGRIGMSNIQETKPKLYSGDADTDATIPDGEGGRIKLPAAQAAANLKNRLQRQAVGAPTKFKKIKDPKPESKPMTDEEHAKLVDSDKYKETEAKFKKIKEGIAAANAKRKKERFNRKQTKEQKEESEKFRKEREKPKEELSKPTTEKIQPADLNVDISGYADDKSLQRRLVQAGYANESKDKKSYKNRKLAEMVLAGDTNIKIKRPPQKTGTKHYWNAPEDKDSLASPSEMQEDTRADHLGGKTEKEQKDVERKHKVPPAKRTGESQSDNDEERGGDASEQDVKEEKEGTKEDREATEYDTATDDLKESDKEEAKLNVAGKHKKTRIRRQRKLGEPPEDVKPETVGDDRKDQKTYRGHTLESDTKGGKYTSGEGSEKEFHDRDGEGQEQDKEKKELARKRKLEAKERKDENRPTKEMEKLEKKLHNSRVRAYVTTLTANQAGRFKKLSPEEQKRKMDEADKKKNKAVAIGTQLQLAKVHLNL